jgi:hydroxymethylbilane synthase
MKLIFATRPSALARWQTQWVISALQAAHPGLECMEKVITTQGDKILDKPLPEIGGKGLFTQELESELLAGTVHCAVHSLKDLPVENPAGLTVGCIPARAEVRDALICRSGFQPDTVGQRPALQQLPAGAVVGTSSLRRAAQVLAARPDLKIESLRGNVDTRLRKALDGQYDAIILAGAGLTRLGLESHVTEWLPLGVMLPAPGQGALAVQCRADDESTLGLLAALEDESTRKEVTAERAFLSGLGGGCSVPVAAYATVSSDQLSVIGLIGLVISPDGKKAVKVLGEGTDADKLGVELAEKAIAEGARDILSLVTAH